MIRVLVADDENVSRAGIIAILHSSSDIEVIAEASNGEETLQIVSVHKTDALLLDFHMPSGISDFELIESILIVDPKTRIILITSEKNDRLLLHAMDMGVKGFLSKDDHTYIIESIHDVVQGKTHIRPIHGYPLAQIARAKPAFNQLSHTQFMICMKLKDGLKPQQIAAEINRTSRYVSNEILKIKKFLHVKDSKKLLYLCKKHLN